MAKPPFRQVATYPLTFPAALSVVDGKLTVKIKSMGFSQPRIASMEKMMQAIFNKDDTAITVLWNDDSSPSAFAYGVMITG